LNQASGLAVLSALYIALGLFGISIVTIDNSSLTLVWLPAGIGAVMAIKYGKTGLAAVFACSFLVNSNSYFQTDTVLHLLKWLSVTTVACSVDTLQSYLVSVLGGKALWEFSSVNKKDMLKLGAKAVFLPPLLTCWILILNNYLFGYIAFNSTEYALSKLFQSLVFLNIADICGIFLMLPLLLVFSTLDDIKKISKPLSLLLLLSLVVVLFLSHYKHYLVNLTFVSLFFLSYIYRLHGATLGIFIVSISTFVFSSFGVGAFIHNSDKLEEFVHILIYIFSIGSIFYLVSVLFEEIEEKSKLELLLIQQSKMAMMGEMIAMIAHQWRQPLNALAINVQDVEAAYSLEELDKEYIVKFKNDSMSIIKKMSKTIDDFREFFRPVKTKEKFVVADAITQVMQIMGPILAANNICVSIKQDKDIELLNHKSEFEQVLLVLLSNSKDAVISSKIENPTIDISVEELDENRARVAIEDNGGGIKAQIIDRIFEPYFTTKEQGQGTGIGLYMAREIIERHMLGKINVSNTKNGARFEIIIKK